MEKNMFENSRKKKSYAFFAVVISTFLGGCHTMEGAGADIKYAGKALEQSAERHKQTTQPCPCCSRP
jgi:predicted small secreted protein